MFIFNDIYQKHISDLDNKDKYRVLPELINKKSEYIDFSTNDYLCLSQNKDVIHAAKEAIDIYGVGATGSRLLSGNNKLFMDFERLIA
jgi:8-amino-7-oxononanoate synthase